MPPRPFRPPRPRICVELVLVLCGFGVFVTSGFYLLDTIFFRVPDHGFSHLLKPYDWKSPYSGWYNRSLAMKDTSNIHLNLSNLRLLSTSSAWGREYFGLAMFEPDLCITRTAILKINHTDFEGCVSLTNKATKIKKTHYTMFPEISNVSTDQLMMKEKDGGDKWYSAYAFHKYSASKKADKMPAVLWELFGLVKRDEIGNWNASDSRELVRVIGEMKGLLREKPGLWELFDNS